MSKSYEKKSTSSFVSNNEIYNNDENVNMYYFKVLINFLINLLIIIGIGIRFDILPYSAIFLVCYVSIRQFSGGYYADNYMKNSIIFLSMFISTILISQYIDINLYKVLIGWISIISFTGIYFLSPVEYRDNPLSKDKIKKYKNRSRLIAFIVVIFNLITLNIEHFNQYSIYISASLLWSFIMLFLGIIKNSKY